MIFDMNSFIVAIYTDKEAHMKKTKELFFSFHPSSVHESCIVSNENDSKVSFLEKFYTVVYNFRTDNRE